MAHGKSGSESKTVYVHVPTGEWVTEDTHPAYATSYTVGRFEPASPWRGERTVLRTFATKREAWDHIRR